MNLSDVLKKVKRRPTRKRCGRGRGSGLGKTSGRGHKGAASRSGWKRRYFFEGGQVPLVRHLPKRGFSNHPFRTRYDVINLDLLEANFQDGETVRLEVLAERGILKPRHGRLKVLGEGALTKKVTIVAQAASETAKQKIATAGAKLEGAAAVPRRVRKPPPPKAARPAAPKKEPAPGKKGESPEEK